MNLKISNSVILILLVLFVSCSGIMKSEENSYFVWIVGDVKIISDGVEKSAELNGVIKKTDTIITGEKSYAAVRINENAMIKLSENSEINFDIILNPGDKSLLLKKGEVTARVDKLLKDDNFEIKTPTALAAVRGTIYSVRYDETGDNIIIVAVLEGKVEVTERNSNKKETASSKQTIVVKSEDQLLEIRDMTEDEELMNASIKDIPVLKKVKIDAQELNRKNTEMMDKVKVIRNKNTEAKRKAMPKSLAEIKEQYGRIDKIILYNGKVIQGVIIKRGEKWTVLIPGKYIYIDSKTVQDTPPSM
ncbi:MAG: FecR domain-containing protein [Spirochaetes bacterium]|nr:FecR domain-containing protein [Spirochaetota bacterium]